MASLGKIEEFNSTSVNIACYLEHLKQYFEVNDVSADTAEVNKQRAILISAIGGKTYDVLSEHMMFYLFTGFTVHEDLYSTR